MNDEVVKAAVGKFLRHVNVTAQREMEKVVRKALSTGKLRSGESLTAAVTVSSDQLEFNVTIFSKIEL
jgi:hypothetical protein